MEGFIVKTILQKSLCAIFIGTSLLTLAPATQAYSVGRYLDWCKAHTKQLCLVAFAAGVLACYLRTPIRDKSMSFEKFAEAFNRSICLIDNISKLPRLLAGSKQ